MSLIVKKNPTAPPQPIDRLDLANCIEHVKQMIPCDLPTMRTRITRLYDEGLDSKDILTMLIDRHHEKEIQFVLGEVTSKKLDLSDLTLCEDRLGINALTDENKAAWLAKFVSGRARYLCPECGYAGNGEFMSLSGCFEGWVSCHRCDHSAYSKYFTHQWTEEEKAKYEAEQAATTARFESNRVEMERQKEFLENVRIEAWEAIEQIDRYRSIHVDGTADDDTGDFPYKFEREGHEEEVERIVSLMLLGLQHGDIRMIVPWDEVVVFFKENLRATDDLSKEFERVVKSMATMLKGGKQ
jgi:hypothetical protein